MARYIDAELLMQKLSRMIDYCRTDPKVSCLTALYQVGDAIIDCPTADVAEAICTDFVKSLSWHEEVGPKGELMDCYYRIGKEDLLKLVAKYMR